MKLYVMAGIWGISAFYCIQAMESTNTPVERHQQSSKNFITLVCKGGEEICVPPSLATISKIYKRLLKCVEIISDTLYCPDLGSTDVSLLVPLCDLLQKKDEVGIKDILYTYAEDQLCILYNAADYLEIPFLLSVLPKFFAEYLKRAKNYICLKKDRRYVDLLPFEDDVKQAIASFLVKSNALFEDIATAIELSSSVFLKCPESIEQLSLSSDSNYIALFYNNTMVLKNEKTGDDVQTFYYSPTVDLIRWTPYEDPISLAIEDDTVYIKNLKTDACLHCLPHAENVELVHLSSNDNHLAVVLSDNTISIWKTAKDNQCTTFYQTDSLPHSRWVNIIQWCSSGTLLALVESDDVHSVIYIWNTQTKKIQAMLPHSDILAGLCWSPDDSLLASLLNEPCDDKVYLWEPRTGDCVYILDHKTPITAISWSPDSMYIAVGFFYNKVCIWHAKTGKYIRVLHTNDYVKIVQWSHDGNSLVLVLCLADGTSSISIWDMRNFFVLHSLDLTQALLLELIADKGIEKIKKYNHLQDIFHTLPVALRKVLDCTHSIPYHLISSRLFYLGKKMGVGAGVYGLSFLCSMYTTWKNMLHV